MDICYNVYPTPPAALSHRREHWLVSIAEGLRYADKSEDRIFVSRDFDNNWVTYLLRSERTKVTAQLQGQGNKIMVSVLNQADVDPYSITMPPGIPVATNVFEMDSNCGLRQAVHYLCLEFNRENIYTRGEQKRIKLSLRPNLSANPPVFFGGVVESVELEDMVEPDEKKGEIHNALVRVGDSRYHNLIQVATLPIAFHPKTYRPLSRCLASKATGERHERVYTFSQESWKTYYQQEVLQ